MDTIFTLNIHILTLYLILLFNKSILLPTNLCKIAGWVANSVDPDQTPRSAASDLGLHCLLRPACPKMLRKYDTLIKSNPLRNHPGSVPICVEGLCQKIRQQDNIRTSAPSEDSDWADQNLQWANFGLPKVQRLRGQRRLIRMGGYAGWVESLLGAHVRRLNVEPVSTYNSCHMHAWRSLWELFVCLC